MTSLRAQLVALVSGAVVLSVLLLSAFGVRSATLQFRATVQETQSMRHGPAGESLARIAALARRAGLDTVVSLVQSSDSALLDGATVLVVAPSGSVLATNDTAYGEARVERRGPAGLSIELRRAGELRRLVLDGGTWLLGSAGDSLALVVELPAPRPASELGVSIDSVSRAFGAGFNRRLWFGAAGILVLALLGALWVTRRVLDPLGRLEDAAARVAGGDYSARVGAAPVSELAPVAGAFDRMAESLERSERSRRQLLRDVAHDLRTPLTNMRAQVESLQDGLRAPDAEALASLHEEIRILERLVADVDVLARAQAGRLELRPEPIDLAEVVGRTVHAFVAAGRLPEDRLRLDLNTAPIRADAGRVGQVARNLVENAVQHGGAGALVSVRVSPMDHGALLEVRDNGPGIAPDHLPHVFDHLYRPDAARARRSAGSGLGLPIVKAIVEAHGGSIEVSSPPGLGTVVATTWPRGGAGAPS